MRKSDWYDYANDSFTPRHRTHHSSADKRMTIDSQHISYSRNIKHSLFECAYGKIDADWRRTVLTYLLKGCDWSVASTAFNTIHSANTCFSSVSNNRELINNGNISPTKYQMLQKTRCAAPMANTISSTRCKFKTVQVSQLDCSHAGMKPLIQSHIRLCKRVSSQYAVLQAQHYHNCDNAMTTLPAAHWL